MATHAGLTYGMTDLVIEPLDASDTPVVAAGVKLANGQTMDITINEDETDEEGYGVVVGTVYSATSADVSLEAAGVDLDALAALTGGTVASSGTTPNVVQTLHVGVEGQARPYCRGPGARWGTTPARRSCGSTRCASACRAAASITRRSTTPRWTGRRSCRAPGRRAGS